MAFDNDQTINNLSTSDTFYTWHNKFNDEIIAKLNEVKVYTGLSGDGISVGVNSPSGELEVELSGNVTKGITFQDVTINGALNYSFTDTESNAGAKFYVDATSTGTAGFTTGMAVRCVIAEGSDQIGITLARSFNADEAEAIGLVSSVGANYVTVVTSGKITGSFVDATDTGSGLTSGCVYFLDPSNNGKITLTEPSSTGLVSKPILVGITGDSGIVVNYRGQQLGLTGASGAAATSIVSVIDVGTAVSGTDLIIGSVVSRKISTKNSALTDGSGRNVYNGVYLSNGSDPYSSSAVPDDGNAYSNEIIGVVTAYPNDTSGNLIEVTSLGIFRPEAVNWESGSNTSQTSPIYLSNTNGKLTSSPTATQIAYRMSDTQLYANIRRSSDTSGARFAASSSSSDSKNSLINGSFRIWQRGKTFTGTTAGDGFYFADRWAVMNGITSNTSGATGSVVITRNEFTRGQTSVEGSPKYYASFTSTLSGLSAASGDYYHIENRIPDSTTFSGADVTLTFYAKASSSGSTIGTQFKQFFQGAETGDKEITTLGSSTLTTQWQKFSLPFTVPGVSSGYTVSGTNDYAAVAFDIRTLGNKTMDLAQVRLFTGTDSYPELEDERLMLDQCREYYQKSYEVDVDPRTGTMNNAFNTDTTPVVFEVGDKNRTYYKFPIKMKKVPSITIYSPQDGYTGDALNMSASNRVEALPLRKTAGTTKRLLGQTLTRTGIAGADTLSVNQTSKANGFILNILYGAVFNDQLAFHYVADGDINVNFKRIT